jgi:glutaredoxin
MTKSLAWIGQSIVAAALAIGVVGVEGAIASMDTSSREISSNILQKAIIPISSDYEQEKQASILLAQRASVIVYGRPGCSLTIDIRNSLYGNSVPYEFKDINDDSIKQQMFDWMQSAKIDTSRRFSLPVVVVNNSYVLVSPDIGDIVDRYKNSASSLPLQVKPQVDNTFYGIFSRTGGFKIKNLDRAVLASEYKPLLSMAIRKTLANGNTSSSKQAYSFFEIDINGDNRKDAFVFLHGDKSKDRSGKNIWLYEALDSGNYRLVEVFQDQLALIPHSQTTLGWNKILQIPGSIVQLASTTKYQDCAVGTRRGPIEGRGIFKSLHFYRYCNTVTNEKFQLSGKLIELPSDEKILQDEIFKLERMVEEKQSALPDHQPDKSNIPITTVTANSAVAQDIPGTQVDQPIGTPLPKTAGTARLPSPQDIALLDRTIRDQKPRAKVADRSQVKALTNNLLKPFVGSWLTADNQKYYVYPSTRTGKGRQACIIIENGTTQNLQIGIAVGNAVGTDMNVGNARMFKTKNDSLLALRTPDSEKLVPLYAGAINAVLTDGNREAMEQNGCMTSFPGLPDGTAIASQPSFTPGNSSANRKPTLAQVQKVLASSLQGQHIIPGETRHNGVYHSSVKGIQVENAICGEKSIALFWTGPGFCSDKNQRSRVLFEDATAFRQPDGTTKIKAKFFNLGYADAAIEVYSQNGTLVDLKILDGYSPPTGFAETSIDLSKTPHYLFSSPYPIDDLRHGRPSKIEELTLPIGGYIKITKSSSIAQAYGIVGVLLDLFQAGSDVKGMSAPPSKTISKEVLINFAKDYATKGAFSLYKGDVTTKALSGHYDNLNLSESSKVLADFGAYVSKFEENQTDIKTENPAMNVLRDIGLTTLNEGIETTTDILLPGLGTAIKKVRIGGQFLNLTMKGAELSVAARPGDKDTIFIRDTGAR